LATRAIAWRWRDMTPGQRARGPWIVVGVTLICAAVVGYTIWSDQSRNPVVYAKDFGADWPYPGQASGRLACRLGSNGRPMTTIDFGGTVFGLNFNAQQTLSLPDSRKLMRVDSSGIYQAGRFLEISELAAKLC
jgi:hypothetical protein